MRKRNNAKMELALKLKDGIVQIVNSDTPSRSSRTSRYNLLHE